MVDFRSKAERAQADRAVQADQADYKRLHDLAMAENRALHGKLDQITANHGALQAQFADLLNQFETLKTASTKRSDDLLEMARNMEDMVATAY
jgi:dynactin complex subunit